MQLTREQLQPAGELRWLSAAAAMTAVASAVALVAGSAAGVPVAEVYSGYFAAAGRILLPALLVFAVPLWIRAMLRGVKHPLAGLRRQL